jgi:type IV secretory pathway TrbD component
MPEPVPLRRNRVFKSLHRPMTYMGIERGLFILTGVSGVVAFNLFDSILAGIVVFIAMAIFGHWVTNKDPAYLRIQLRSSKYKPRYDAAKQTVPKVQID